jgi:hypothetical protein
LLPDRVSVQPSLAVAVAGTEDGLTSVGGGGVGSAEAGAADAKAVRITAATVAIRVRRWAMLCLFVAIWSPFVVVLA